MNVFLLIFSLICISVTTAQDCARKNETYTHIAKPLKTKTPQECEAKCDKSPPCTSWTWNKKNKKCYLIREFNLAERTSWISGICREDPDPRKITVTNNFNKPVKFDVACARQNIPIGNGQTIQFIPCSTTIITSTSCASPPTQNQFKDYVIINANNQCQFNPVLNSPYTFTVGVTNNFGQIVDIQIVCFDQSLEVGTPLNNVIKYIPCERVIVTGTYNGGRQNCKTSYRGMLKNLRIVPNKAGDSCVIA